jgi:hypothetical protein
VVFLFHLSEMDVQEQPGHPGSCRRHPGDMRRVRTPDVRAAPGHVQAVCDACNNSVNDDVPRIQSGLLSPPSSAPRVLMGCTLRLQTPPDASGLCASPDGSRWNLELDDRRCVLSSCPHIAWNPGCTRETRYAHAEDGKVFSSLFRKEKLRSLRMSALTNEPMPPHKALVLHTYKRASLMPQIRGVLRDRCPR